MVVRRFFDLAGIQRPDLLGVVVRIPAYIFEMSERSVKKVGDCAVNALEVVVLRDRQGNTLPLMQVVGNEAVERIHGAFVHSTEMELEAEVTLTGGAQYALLYRQAQPVRSLLQVHGVTAVEEKEAEAMVEGMPGPLALLAWIVKEVIEILNLRRVGEVPELMAAIKGVILQAVSHGRIDGTPGRVHLLLIGPPGCSKGVVHRASRLLNGIFELIGTNSITPAGLVGYSERCGPGRTRQVPGKLATASLGTASMEDLQHIDTFSKRHTFGILCDMMERGTLVRTVFQSITMHVDTALLADINPRSSLRPVHDRNDDVLYLDDLDLPLNFLSRVDLAVMFGGCVEHNLDVMQEIMADTAAVGPAAMKPEQAGRIRHLRVLMAYLRDVCATVDVTPVKDLVLDRARAIREQNKEKLEQLNLATDFLLRSGKTIPKLVAASARLHGRCEAEPVDVELAFELFEEKMKFLNRLEPAFEPVANARGSAEAAKLRQQRILEHFSGRDVHLDTLAELFTEVGEKTLKRDLQAIGATSQGAGVWRVPERPKPAQRGQDAAGG